MRGTDGEHMITWVSLVHAGSFFPAALSSHLQDELGVSLAEQDLLKQLGTANGELKLVELSRRIYLSKAGVTKMVDRLEDAGLVVRVRSEDDRRVVMARMTPAGKKLLGQSRRLIVKWVEVNLRDSLTSKQLRGLREGLEALLRNHDRWEGQMRHLKGG